MTGAETNSFRASADIEFGTVTVGQMADSSVTLVNEGSTAISVINLNVTGNGFAVTSPSTLPISVAANSTYRVNVRFKPNASGDSTGQLTISSTSTTSPSLKTKLHGDGASSSRSGSPALGSFSCSQSSITGAGSDACTVTLSVAAGTSGRVVRLSSSNNVLRVPEAVTVPAGATSAGFTASVSAVTTSQTATLTASAGGTTRTYAINLGAAIPALTPEATRVTFGDVDLHMSATQPVMLTSSGTAPLTIRAGSVSGTEFSISGVSFPATLYPGQTATLYIQFDPTRAGATTGTVTLTSNAAPSATTIRLSGTGATVSYQVNLVWNAPVNSADPVTGYNVYRATGNSSSYQLINPYPEVSTAYTDSTVENGTSYTYFVQSVDAEGNHSVPSATYSVSIP